MDDISNNNDSVEIKTISFLDGEFDLNELELQYITVCNNFNQALCGLKSKESYNLMYCFPKLKKISDLEDLVKKVKSCSKSPTFAKANISSIKGLDFEDINDTYLDVDDFFDKPTEEYIEDFDLFNAYSKDPEPMKFNVCKLKYIPHAALYYAAFGGYNPGSAYIFKYNNETYVLGVSYY